MRYRYWFTLLLLLIALTAALLIIPFCMTGSCAAFGYKNIIGLAASQAVEGNTTSMVLLVLLLVLLVLMVWVLILSIFVYLKKEHVRKGII